MENTLSSIILYKCIFSPFKALSPIKDVSLLEHWIIKAIASKILDFPDLLGLRSTYEYI
jgi:hypothetical protein